MSFGEGNLRTAVRDLQDEIARLESRCAELEALVREMYGYLESDYPPSIFEPFAERMRGLGVEVE